MYSLFSNNLYSRRSIVGLTKDQKSSNKYSYNLHIAVYKIYDSQGLSDGIFICRYKKLFMLFLRTGIYIEIKLM